MKKTVAAISGVALLVALALPLDTLALPLDALAKDADPFNEGTAEIGVNLGPPLGPYVGMFVKDNLELGGLSFTPRTIETRRSGSTSGCATSSRVWTGTVSARSPSLA